MTQAEWFEDWFDSPYYHILYKYRDDSEAEGFIDHLLQTLQPKAAAKVLDLACGRGRYSRYLAGKGYEVCGLDLSPQSIAHARQFERDNLSFFVHDMREPFRTDAFDYIFSFFTSFGYFDTETEDLATLKNVRLGLKPGGMFVLDFFNSEYVRQQLTGPEQKTIDGITFGLHKRIAGNKVVKTIRFRSREGQDYYFEERVRLMELEDFQRLFAAAGLHIVKTYGDYQLQPFDPENSPRLIVEAKPA